MKEFKRIYKDELEVQGMNELTREQILNMKKITRKYQKEDGSTFVTYCGDKNPYSEPLTITEILFEEHKPKDIIQDILLQLSYYEDLFNSIESHGKWTRETVWIYRNDRGDIMRAQDEHPAAASEEVERIYRKDDDLDE